MIPWSLLPHVLALGSFLIAIKMLPQSSNDPQQRPVSSASLMLGRGAMVLGLLAILCSGWIGLTAGLSISGWLFFAVHAAAVVLVLAAAVYWIAASLL